MKIACDADMTLYIYIYMYVLWILPQKPNFGLFKLADTFLFLNLKNMHSRHFKKIYYLYFSYSFLLIIVHTF